MAFGIDPNVLNQLRTFDDYRRAEEEFNVKKQLLIQDSVLKQAQLQSALATAANGGLTTKDMFGFQLRAQENATDNAYRQQQADNTAAFRQFQIENANDQRERDRLLRSDLANQQLETERTRKEEEKNKIFLNDQNLTNSTAAQFDKQIAAVDALFDANGNLNPDVAANYGTVAGFQLPVVQQGTRDAKTLIDQVNAQALIGQLAELKSQSATGASGFGSLTVSEGDKLQSSASSAADTRQSAEAAAQAFKLYRQNLKEGRDRLMTGFDNLYSSRFGKTNTSSPNSTKPALSTEQRQKLKAAGFSGAEIEMYEMQQGAR